MSTTEQRRAKSSFPHDISDHDSWLRLGMTEHLEGTRAARDIIVRLTENLHARACAPDFDAKDSGEIQAFGDCLDWIFDMVNRDTYELQMQIEELDERKGIRETSR
jgi:hypothetical protein